MSTSPAGSTSALDPVKSFSLKREFQRFSRGEIPCARESLLMGLGTGFAISAVGLVARRGIKSSLNWGVAALTVSSVAKHYSCQYDRKMEMDRMRVVVEDFRRKKSKKDTSSTSDTPVGQEGPVEAVQNDSPS